MITELKEVTKWSWPNHTYFIDSVSGKMIAYIKEGTSKKITFKKPLPFYKSRRRFKKL